MKKTGWLIAGCMAITVVLYAQELPVVTIPGSEVRKITSSIVAGQEYELQILLPGNYKSSDKKYPVLYLMDSQWDFPLAKSLYGQHYFDGFIPELIIVGVTWAGKNANADSLRARDYTPTNEKRLPQSGGADRFISFMRNELFPFIESNYKTDPADRTLMGCSLGGLFTMYTLFTNPGMFRGYIAASPAYGWDREVLYQFEKKYFDSHPTQQARLYLTMGDVERGLPGFEKLAKHLSERKYPLLSIRSKILENTGHSGTKTEGFGRGMQYVFQRKDEPIRQQTVLPFTGMYQLAPGGATIEIRLENEELYLYTAPNNRYKLFSESATDYYAKSEFLQIHFFTGSGRKTGMILKRYGRTDTGIKQ